MEHHQHKDDPLQALFVGQGAGDNHPQPTINMLVRHGVRPCLEYAKSGDVQRRASFPTGICHRTCRLLTWPAMGMQLPAASDRLETEFVCLPRPIVSQDQPDGGTYSLLGSTRCKTLGQGRTSEA